MINPNEYSALADSLQTELRELADTIRKSCTDEDAIRILLKSINATRIAYSEVVA